MSEKISPKAVVAGGNPSGPVAAVHSVAGGSQPSVPVAAGPVAVAKPPALFGGHKGGGKKRADGLVAGSPEAIKADKEKDMERKRRERAEKKMAAMPPPLPGVAAPAQGAPAPVAGGESPVPRVADGAAPPVAGPMPLFVAWSAKMIERPVKLFSRIVDRLRVSALMQRVRKLNLGKEIEDEAEKRFAFKAEAVNDFNAALTNCAVIELNKRRVAGAQHSHWVELAMTGGELVAVTLDQMDWLEKQILQKAESEKRKTETVKP